MAALDKTVFKAARKARGLTQEALAEKLNVAGPTVQRYENGTRSPTTIARLVDLCDVLGVSADALLGRQPVPSAHFLTALIEEVLAARGPDAPPSELSADLGKALNKRLSELAGMPQRNK